MEGLQNKKSQLMGIGFMIVLMIGSICYILKDENIFNIYKIIKSVNPIFIILAVLLMIFYILCEGINIWITMKALDKKTTLMDCFGYGFVGFYFSSITPSASGGQPAQVYFMNKKGISITSSSLGLLVLLFAHQLVVVVYGVIALIIRPSFVITHRTSFNLLLAYGVVSNAVILIGILLLIFYPQIVYKMINFFGKLMYKSRFIKNKEKFGNRVQGAVNEYRNGAIYMRNNPRVIFYVTLVTTVQITALFYIPYIIYCGLGLNSIGPMEIILTQAILNIAVSSLPLPGSVGASESVFVDMFRSFFGNLVIPGMILTRLANFYIVLIISGIISLYMYVKNTGRKRIRDNE